jgi:hypothetical protein
MNGLRTVVTGAATLLLAGCMTPWTKVEESRQTSADGSFAIDAPVGWVRFTMNRDQLLITRDGSTIQFISVALRPHDKAFEKIKRKSDENLLPTELADLTVAELRTQPILQNIEIIDNQPRAVGGRPGFALHLQYRTERGAPFDRVVYGAAFKDGVLFFTYNALHIYYFERDRAVFDQVVASYKPLGDATAAR